MAFGVLSISIKHSQLITNFNIFVALVSTISTLYMLSVPIVINDKCVDTLQCTSIQIITE